MCIRDRVRGPEIAPIMSQALASSFRSTTRVSAVILHWEEWLQGQTGGAARLTRFRIEHNPRAAVSLRGCGDFLDPLPDHQSWQYIMRIVRNSSNATPLSAK